jgi:uncharacterized protein (UPF0335 family)
MVAAANSLEGKAAPFLKRVEALMAEGESAKGTYMAECKERREDIKQVYTEAKDAGVPVKALKGVVKKRSLERKAEAIPDGFDIDESAAYETLCEALGPLGKAAAVAAGHAVDDDDRDLRGNAQREADVQRADEAALEQVGRG